MVDRTFIAEAPVMSNGQCVELGQSMVMAYIPRRSARELSNLSIKDGGNRCCLDDCHDRDAVDRMDLPP